MYSTTGFHGCGVFMWCIIPITTWILPLPSVFILANWWVLSFFAVPLYFCRVLQPKDVLVYEILFEGATQFHHSNMRLPIEKERLLSKLIVTPRMHGIHHSVVRQETDSNYSVIFSIWDRLFNTVCLNVPQDKIIIGVPAYSHPEELTVGTLLKLPFTKVRQMTTRNHLHINRHPFLKEIN